MPVLEVGVLLFAGVERELGHGVRDQEHPPWVAPQHAAQPRRAVSDGADGGSEVAPGRRPGTGTRHLGDLLEGPPHGGCHACVVRMSRKEDVAHERPVGRGHGRPQWGELARTAGGAGRGGSAGADCPNNGGRSFGTTAGPPLQERAGPGPAAGARQAAVSASALAAAAAPAERGGFRHFRPFGSYGSRMPGVTDGRTGAVGRRPGGPEVVGATAANADPGAAAAVDGHDGGAGDEVPTGPAGGVAGDGSISAEGDVVPQGPLCAKRPPRGRWRRRRTRYPTLGGDASGGGGRRGGDAGTGARRRPRLPARATREAYPTRRARHAGPAGRRIGAPERALARPRGRGRRRPTGRHAAGAARCARDGFFPSSVMIASGDLTFMEGIICIGW